MNSTISTFFLLDICNVKYILHISPANDNLSGKSKASRLDSHFIKRYYNIFKFKYSTPGLKQH